MEVGSSEGTREMKPHFWQSCKAMQIFREKESCGRVEFIVGISFNKDFCFFSVEVPFKLL